MTGLIVTKYMCHSSDDHRYVSLFVITIGPFFIQFMTDQRICNKRDRKGVTSGAGTG